MAEMKGKLELIRAVLEQEQIAAVRLRGLDWFAWCTAGGFGGVLLAAETGVAEVLVSRTGVWILTDVIEANRLQDEEVPEEFEVLADPWQNPLRRESRLREMVPGGKIASDRPTHAELPLPEKLIHAKRHLLPEEITRLSELGQDAARAMTESIREARPEWTELELAGHASLALRRRGIDPALVQVGGEERVLKYRHLLPTTARIGRRAMVAFCARRHGLYASISRYVYFGAPTLEEQRYLDAVARIESVALSACESKQNLGSIYDRLAKAYASEGFADEIHRHHQGGTTGYLAREVIARPGDLTRVDEGAAIAFNPSLTGTKIEDTFVLTGNGLQLMTRDEHWPMFQIDGRKRPGVWVNP